MSTETLLSLILIVVTAVLVIALVAAVGLAAAALKWQRSRGRGIPGLSILGRRRRAPAPSPQPSTAAQPTPQTPAARPVARESGPTPRGDAPADHPRILELGLEEPASCEAVLRNLERIKPLLHQEAPEGDRMGRVTPLVGRALRSAGLFRWGFPQERGGLSASFAERLEAITQLARVDVGTAWVTTWLSAHGDIATYSPMRRSLRSTPRRPAHRVLRQPLARAVEVEGDRYRLDEGTTWRLGSGGYHAERWIGGAMVWDTNGEPVICEQTGEQKIIGVWLPPEKVRQLDDWDPLGVRSSGSASYRLTETIEVPRRHSFNVGADRRPYFFSFMGSWSAPPSTSST
ncbi:hypothetical protein [Nesterenkonia pannonica]|uniref:hypothetical protein n=1 Tax=Nesterenkonia pannonica TaxID=1548602 RepID=UPI0021649B9E|nr:hypothetical protein [Nesterenkonia pannonica]